MIGSRYQRVDTKRPDIYAVVGPSSEIGSMREWILRNEKNQADELIAPSDGAGESKDLEEPRLVVNGRSVATARSFNADE
jgi:hypothetical protein